MRKSIFTFGIAALILCGCGNKVIEGSGDVLNIIMETDIGNDIDDAMAMDLLYKYLDAGKINLLAVNINKEPLRLNMLTSSTHGTVTRTSR